MSEKIVELRDDPAVGQVVLVGGWRGGRYRFSAWRVEEWGTGPYKEGVVLRPVLLRDASTPRKSRSVFLDKDKFWNMGPHIEVQDE